MRELIPLRDSGEDPPEKVSMHPEDYRALLAWVRAKDREENGRG